MCSEASFSRKLDVNSVSIEANLHYLWMFNLTISLFAIADDDFEDLCFEFGVELEHGTAEEMQMNRVDGDGNTVDISDQYVYKIEVAANRYDLLCVEGIASAFRIYLGLDT